jgi:hypothetical protein
MGKNQLKTQEVRVDEVPTVLSVSPVVGLWRHSSLEISLIEQLIQQEAKVIALSCDGLAISRCSYIDLHERTGRQNSRIQACTECIVRDSVRQNVLNSPRIEFVKITKEPNFDAWLSEQNLEAPESLVWQQMEVGRYSCYDLALNLKCEPQQVPIIARRQYIQALSTAISIYSTVSKICMNQRVDVVTFHNGLLSLNRTAWEWCKLNEIQTIDVMNVSDVVYRDSKYYLNNDLWPLFYGNKDSGWETVKKSRLSATEKEFVASHLHSELKLGGIKGYGKGEVSKRLEIQRSGSQNFVILCLFNSEDERKTAKFVHINENQKIESLWEHLDLSLRLAKKYPKCKFLFRLHPRMGRDRAGNASPYLQQVQKFLENAPDNVEVIFPNHEVSLNDSLNVCNLVISFGSTAGLLASASGKPVILASDRFDWNFPREIYFTPNIFGFGEISKLIDRFVELRVEPNEIEATTAYAQKAINYIHNILTLNFFLEKRGKIQIFLGVLNPVFWRKVWSRVCILRSEGLRVRSWLSYFRIAYHSFTNSQSKPTQGREFQVWREILKHSKKPLADILVETYQQKSKSTKDTWRGGTRL